MQARTSERVFPMTYLFTAIGILPVIAVGAAILYTPLALLLHRKKAPYPFIRHVGNYVLLGYFLALVWVTFFWASTNLPLTLEERLHLLPGSSFLYAFQYDGGLWSSQIMWNVCLFMPLGALLPCVFLPLREHAWETILLCLLLTLSIETAQFFIGRVADMDDVICNTLGGVFGRALYTVCAWAFRRVRFFGPLFTDRAKAFGHAAAIAAMVLILLVPSVLDVVNAHLPCGLFPIA